MGKKNTKSQMSLNSPPPPRQKKERDRKSHCLNTIDFQKKNTLCCMNIQGDDFVPKLDTYSIRSSSFTIKQACAIVGQYKAKSTL